ncbi:MAG: DUF6088 family protein [Eubacteriales bacterium]
MNINYSEYMTNMIETFPIGAPIFTETVVRAASNEIGAPIDEIKSVVNLNLKRLADNKVIERIQKGVYYKPKITAFGKTKPPIDLVIMETCMKQDNQQIGYIGAETLLHNLGLATLAPKNKVIVTNKHRVKVPKGNHIILKKPVTEITDKNTRYLQIIDAIAMLDTEYIDAENPAKIIAQTIERFALDKLTIIKIAKKHYSQRVVLAVLETVLEDDYEITHG